MTESGRATCENLLKGYSMEARELIIRLDTLRRALTNKNVELYIITNMMDSYYKTLGDSPLDLVEMLDYVSQHIKKTAENLHKIENELEKFSSGAEELSRKITNCLKFR